MPWISLSRSSHINLAAYWTGARHTAGDKLAALLSRAPDGMAHQALLALRERLPAADLERVTPAHLRVVLDV